MNLTTYTLNSLMFIALVYSSSFYMNDLQDVIRSKMERLRNKLADLLNTEREKVDIFSVQLRKRYPPLTDIRFSAHGSPYYKPVKLNGLVLMHREEVINPWTLLGYSELALP